MFIIFKRLNGEIEDEIKIRRPRKGIVLDQIQFKKRISVGQNIFEYPISYHMS